MTAVRTARQRARTELTGEITRSARAQLAEHGAAGLSLRAVARELGMVSSALYRYFPSRDELLTALILEAYGSLADAGAAAQARVSRTDYRRRWLVTCRAVRRWAIAHPHEYALIYGSPVPGYMAPQETIEPAARVMLLFVDVVRDAALNGALRDDDAQRATLAPRLEAQLRKVTEEFAAGVPEAQLA
ncbi:MAG: TetR/AcrR family transcriptional regulator, partial [Geodermatophilaceae bacterium]|nr:TetR/AcrR family transcriptional regulator [Geodermatophilaceae bacterium]